MSGTDWIRLLPVGEVTEGKIHSTKARDVEVILLNSAGSIFAYRDACPHEGFSFSKHGEIRDDVLICNKHLWEFEIWNGHHVSRVPRPQCNLHGYEVRESDGFIEIDITSQL